MDNKELFYNLCNENIKRDGIDKLLNWLEKTDFFTAPASTRFHGAKENGLIEHSLNVYQMLLSNGIDNSNIETKTIVSLFHDLCKVNFYKVDYRNAKNDKGVWEKVPYYVVEDEFPYGHGEKSVYIINSFLKLTTEEAMAIRWHMGGFDDSVKGGSYALSNAFEKYPLALELHIADMRATYILEK